MNEIVSPYKSNFYTVGSEMQEVGRQMHRPFPTSFL